MKYQWDQSDSIVEEIRYTPPGKKRAAEALVMLRKQDEIIEHPLDENLVEKGFSVTYDMVEGHAAIRVTGFRNVEQVIDSLQASEAAKGEYQKSSGGKEVEPTTQQKIKENSLWFSAVAYQLGNLMTALSGWFRKDMNELGSGLAFAVGDTTMLLFGKRTDEEKHQEVMQGFGESLLKNGYLPAFGSPFSAGAESAHQTRWQKVRNFMHDKVIAIKSASEITAGYNLFRAGQKQKNTYKKTAGGLIASGFALGLAIPEKTNSELRDELGVATTEQAEEAIAGKSFFSRLKYRILQAPLLIPGFFAALNNLFTIFGAFDEQRHRWQKKDIANRLGERDDGLNGLEVAMQGKLVGEKKLFGKGPKTQTVTDVKETAYSKKNRLAYLVETSSVSPSQKVLYKEELKLADKELKTLEAEQEAVLGGRYNNEKQADKFWIFNLMQGLFFLVANNLYGMSSKSGRSAGDELLGKQFVAAAASEIMLTPPEDRAEVINLAAHYAGNSETMDFTAAEMRGLIEEKLTQLEKHNLFKPLGPEIVEIEPEKAPDQQVEAGHAKDSAPAPKEAEALEKEERPGAAFTERYGNDSEPTKPKKRSLKPEQFLPQDALDGVPAGVTLH